MTIKNLKGENNGTFRKKLSTLEEVKKAYENLSDDDRKAFHQSIADRVHESVAAQEKDEGQENKQSADAREHEALGEEHADGKGETAELHEDDDTEEEKAEDKEDEEKLEGKKSAKGEEVKPETDKKDDFEERLGSLEKKIEEMLKRIHEEKTTLEQKREKYGLSGGNAAVKSAKRYEERDIDTLLGK